MGAITIDEARSGKWLLQNGLRIFFQDKEGRVRKGTVRLKEVRCGHEGCTKCPHKIYAYAQYRVGKKVSEKYIGVAR